jgi:amidohydrolase
LIFLFLLTTSDMIAWRPEDDPNIRPPLQEGQVYRPDILDVIETSIDGLSGELRALSLDIHDHPELRFEEKYAHDAYTAFMEKHGFIVTKKHHLETAWVAIYTHGQGGRALGINSEMDALPGIGHACGHNLIGVSGVAVALAAKAAMEKLNIDGKVVLLGTPAEEGGFGKIMLHEKGAYDEMDVCLMCHPTPGPRHSISLTSTLAFSTIIVEYQGHTAHAGLSPWEGRNALDAAVLAYNNVSLLRQQIKPTHRVQGIFKGKDWAPNIIPDQAKMEWLVRAPTTSEMEDTRRRVTACFEAAALASGCKVRITVTSTLNEITQNKALGDELADVVLKRYGTIDYEWGIKSASTDFGNISYLMPGLHPGFAIPTIPDGGNHTLGFTESARSEVSHDACLVVSKALAAVGMRVLTDEAFLQKVKDAFEEDKKLRV